MLSSRSIPEYMNNEEYRNNISSRGLTRTLNKIPDAGIWQNQHATPWNAAAHNHCAMYDLGNKYLLLTLDYTAPIFDDPLLFGKLAASRAVSSLFACGGQPLVANSIRSANSDGFDDDRIAAMINGAQTVMDQFGITIDGAGNACSRQALLGFSIVGEIEKNRLRKNNSARAGDLIVMTKPIGLGIYTDAIKKGLLGEANVCPSIIELITEHNALGRELSAHSGVSSVTGISELGLIGHLAEMIRPAEVDAMLCHRRIPYLDGVQKLAASMTGNAGAIFSNIKKYAPHISYHTEVPLEEELLIHDPQLNGGLLFTVDRQTYMAHRQSWTDLCPSLCVIGEMVEGNGVIEVH